MTTTAPLFLDTNARTINRYLFGLLLLYAGLIGTTVAIGRNDFLATTVIVPGAIAIVLFPRVALMLFAASIFVELPTSIQTTVLVSDLTALLLISAALIDLFVGRTLPRAFATLSFHFISLMVVVFITTIFSTRPELAASSFARLLMLTAVFLSVYRIAGKIGFGFIPKLFFFLCALYSIPAIIAAAATGGALRSFGFSRLVLDDFTMLSLPVGLTLFLFAKRNVAVWYLVGMALVLGGLLATQSRFAIVLSLLMCLLVLYIVRRNRSSAALAIAESVKSLWKRAGKRIAVLFFAGCAMAAILLAFQHYLIDAVIGRFDVALGGGRIGDSYVTRLALWSAAFKAFLDHPILGIGPGNFRSIMYLYPELSLSYAYLWVRGFSSHNLLLHYLAETGIVGGVTIISLFLAALRYSLQSWKKNKLTEKAGESLAILIVAVIFAITAFFEAGWMWGQTGFVMALFMGGIARQRESLSGQK